VRLLRRAAKYEAPRFGVSVAARPKANDTPLSSEWSTSARSRLVQRSAATSFSKEAQICCSRGVLNPDGHRLTIKAHGRDASEIAMALKIGRASVYRVLDADNKPPAGHNTRRRITRDRVHRLVLNLRMTTCNLLSVVRGRCGCCYRGCV
jgi:hypothetical protein